jgi:hypothetical protein
VGKRSPSRAIFSKAEIAFLDTFRDSLEEISPELGVTDPIIGSVVIDE